MPTPTITERFAEVERLILKTCREFSHQYGKDFEDCFSEAQEHFLTACQKFDESKGAKFSTYVRNTIWFRLMDSRRKELKRNELLKREDSEALDCCTSIQITDFDIDDFIKLMRLSEDASFVVKLCLANEYEPSFRKGQQEIRAGLMKSGWSSKRCSTAFQEISNAMNKG